MTSKDVSFLSNLKNRKEGLNMIETVDLKFKKAPQHLECSCGGEMDMFHTSKSFPYTVGSNERRLTILNAPLYKCNNCSKVVENILLYAEVEKAIEEEIFIRLNKRQAIPNQMNFSEFITN